MIALRLLLRAFVLALPSFLALGALCAAAGLRVLPATIAAVLVYLAVAALMWPFVAGVAAVRRAVDTMAANEQATSEVESLSPTVRELWLVLARWARAARARLKEREGELEAARAVLAGLPEPLVLLDDGRRILDANAAATELFGSRLVGRDLAATLRHPAVLAAADAVLRGERSRIVAFEMTAPVERHLSAHLARLSPHAAGGAAAVLVLHDLTDVKRSERMRADFVANASHELRTPLATLVGFIETLRGPARDDPEARDRFLAIMAEQAGRMARLVDDLLSLSRIEMNEHRPPVGRVELAPVLRAVADSLEQRAARRDMRIRLEAPDDAGAVVGDADELTQVFQNLVDNALKYGRAGTPVEIALRPSRRFLAGARPGERAAALAVSVRDEGEGIPRAHLPRLTERFYRVDPARSRELGGTGLGLAIVKHIVSRHRGALEIDSVLGEGSTFTVHLPVAPAASGAALS
jgi:two-component system phosphate regulon sensor histidine kinase PhoR